MGAVSAVFSSAAVRPLAVAAAKSKIGHTEAGAGVMGLTHAHHALALRTTQVRACVHVGVCVGGATLRRVPG